MSTIKSNNEDMTINADGASSEVKFQANGVEKASISSAGAFTSTTIDDTKLTGNLPAIDGSSLTNLPAGGKVLQVVSGETSTSVTNRTTSFVDTNLTATITPSATSSKILVLVNQSGVKKNGDEGVNLRLTGGSLGNKNFATGVGDTASGINNHIGSQTGSFVDSPNTTSATTYKTTFRALNGDPSGVYGRYAYVQYGSNQTSSITLIELDYS